MHTLLTDDLVRRIERTRAEYRFLRLRALRDSGLELDEGPFRVAEFGRALATDWSPMPRVFCLEATDADRLDAVLAWYAETDRSPLFEVLPLDTNRGLFDALSARGFAPRYTISVLFRDVSVGDPSDVGPAIDGIMIRPSPQSEIGRWVEAYIDGHGWTCSDDERPKWIAELSAQYVPQTISRYAAEQDGAIVAVAASYHAGGAHSHLTNCATLADHRGAGLHAALIAHRLGELRDAGVTIVAADTTPQSGSQRNLERAGFRIAYQKTHWERRSDGVATA